jgi:ketosteroid isomerase-like protein
MTVRFADAIEHGDIDGIVARLTNDAWVTMPPEPYEYQGRNAIAAFLRDRAALRGGDFRLAPTRANGQPAFGLGSRDPSRRGRAPRGAPHCSARTRLCCSAMGCPTRQGSSEE